MVRPLFLLQTWQPGPYTSCKACARSERRRTCVLLPQPVAPLTTSTRCAASASSTAHACAAAGSRARATRMAAVRALVCHSRCLACVAALAVASHSSHLLSCNTNRAIHLAHLVPV